MEKEDINELIRAAAGALDLTNFKGDIVMYKHVDKEMNIAEGGIGEQHIHTHLGKDGVMDGLPSPETKELIEILDSEVRTRLETSTQPKHVLLPVKGAKEAGMALPFSTVEQFNERYGCNISDAGWSHWINGSENYSYKDEELLPYFRMFGGER